MYDREIPSLGDLSGDRDCVPGVQFGSQKQRGGGDEAEHCYTTAQTKYMYMYVELYETGRLQHLSPFRSALDINSSNFISTMCMYSVFTMYAHVAADLAVIE